MPCGCIENKNLDKDKLSLESMQTLSIDEIINLYRQGYTLEESENFTNIISLATKAHPNIEGTTARYDGSSTIPMLLYGNSGSYGYVHLEAYLVSATISEIRECANVMTDLYRLAVFPAISGAVYDIKFRAKACDTFATETCTTCTDEVQVSSWATGVYPGANITTPPPTPTGLTITPGNSYLMLSWNEVSDPLGSGEVFAYKVTVTGPNGPTGYRPSGSPGRTVTISGLTNGTSYSISVKSLSHNNVESTGAATGSGTPSLSTTTTTTTPPPTTTTTTTPPPTTTTTTTPPPTTTTTTTPPPTIVLTSIIISPPSQSISVNSTIPLAAVCKNQFGNTMLCPTLTWLSSNTSKATVSSSGLVTGVAEGTANVTARASGVTSNASVITVATTPPPQAGGGGTIVIAAVALVAVAMFMMRKPPIPPT